MIDYFALALGHGLMAIALLRLVLRDNLDSDPLLGRLKDETAANRMASSIAGRNAARRARGQQPEAGAGDEGAVNRAQAAERERTSSRAQAAERGRTSSRAQAAER
jgi:hypothetical protein